jgi:hypothetical protein
LPKLRDIEFSVRFEVGDGSARVVGVPRDEERLTRDDITSTVHYLRFPFAADQAQQLADGPARLVVDHPAYRAEVELDANQRAELAGDLA